MDFETDLLEYGRPFDGQMPWVDAKGRENEGPVRGAETGQHRLRMGGAIAAIDYMKARRVESDADRVKRHRTRRH